MALWYVARLTSGKYGVYRQGGQRVSIHDTKRAAVRHKIRLMILDRRRYRKQNAA